MVKKIFRSTVCSFSAELRQRQIVRGLGLAAVATLIVTAQMQRMGRIHSSIKLPAAPMTTAAATPQSSQLLLSAYTPETVAKANPTLAHNKTLEKITPNLPTHWAMQSFTVKNSFTRTAHQAGLTQAEILGLNQIFAEKIDFKHLRLGDRFKIITERIPSSKPSAKPIDRIIAAQFISSKNNYLAIRYANPQTHQVNYYQSNGLGLTASFLRYPTHYTRIGSGFQLHRLDPVTGVYHSHPAIDFDAPTDTPIVATADGKINFMANENGYGNVVKINHAGQVMTLYAHMHRFAPNLHSGSFVKKGQVIGYVGMTGYATGPHVHYELHFGATPVNPLTAKLPSASMIAANQKVKFSQLSKQISRYFS